jgi:hypothetical protein
MTISLAREAWFGTAAVPDFHRCPHSGAEQVRNLPRVVFG